MSDPVVLLSTGDVVGPAGGVTDNSMVLFSGTSGKLIKGNNAQVTSAGLALLDDIDANAQLTTLGLTTTQPQFDNSVKQATTEFVQRALGNLAGSFGIAGAMTLTASHCGKIGTLGTGSSYAVTLPLLSQVTDGAAIIFQAIDTGTYSIQRQGTDVIQTAIGTVTSIPNVKGGDSLTFIADKNYNVWRCVGAFANLLATNGYQKLPSGLIVQWGSSVGGATVTLPIAFPNAMLQGFTSDSGVICAAGGIDTMTTTNFKLYSRDFNGTYSAFTLRWLAIGY